MKVADPTVLHKTDRGLVKVGLRSATEVAAAIEDFRAELGATSVDVRVKPVLTGVEVACGVVRDEVFGPLVRVAAGGIATEIWRDEVTTCRLRSLPPTRRVPCAGCGSGRCSTGSEAANGSTWTPSRRSWWRSAS